MGPDRWTAATVRGEDTREKIVSEWASSGSLQVIHQAEIWPAIVSRIVWKQRLHRRKVILFVDNDAARISLIKGDSGNAHSSALAWCFNDFDLEQQWRLWITRVPSSSNPGDAPSRLDFETNWKLFGCTTVPMPEIAMESGARPWEVVLVWNNGEGH